MSYQEGVVGRGYNRALLRIEHRPLSVPHSREYLLRTLDVLSESGVDAWWYSVSAKGSFPLFPSKVLPYKKDVATDMYPWLVEEAHKRGIVMVSWEYLNTAPLLTREHPDWRVRFLDEPGYPTERHNHFVCFNSPYGELLKEYCVEVLNDLNFDAIWFDGCYLFGPAADGWLWSCCCERCAKAFKEAIGETIPRKIDWTDPVFREFIKWRYDFFEGYWAELTDYVRGKSAHGLIALNHFNRMYMGAVSGSPLRHRPIDALVAAEGWTSSLQMQLKTLRAVSDTYPPEVWTVFGDGVNPSYPLGPNPDPSAAIFYIQAAATAGGYASFGMEDPEGSGITLKEISSAVGPLKSYVGGEPVGCCGLVFSGLTKDFANCAEVPGFVRSDRHKPAVDTAYGMGFLLNHLHIPFEIVLDNQFDGNLEKFPVLFLGDVQCMEDNAAEALKDYVAKGGTLIVTGESGTKTPMGRERETGVLDELLGIGARRTEREYCILEPVEGALSGDGLPPRYMVSGKARLVRARDGTRVLATAKMKIKKRAGTNNFAAKLLPPDIIEGAAVLERRVGKGRVVFIAPDIGSDYSQNPNRRSRELIRRLIGFNPAPFTTDAPANVELAIYRKDGNLVIHVLNKPATMFRRTGKEFQLSPEDITPTGPVRIWMDVLSDGIFSPTAGDELVVNETAKGVEIGLPRLENYHLIIIPER